MNCPRCVTGTGHVNAASPYRGELRQGTVTGLTPEDHPHGPKIMRCKSCRGAFVEYADLITIESRARSKKSGSLGSAGRNQRVWDPPTEAIACPSCNGETTRREWSIGTMLFVDVCIECRGVWLDGGELETIG